MNGSNNQISANWIVARPVGVATRGLGKIAQDGFRVGTLQQRQVAIVPLDRKIKFPWLKPREGLNCYNITHLPSGKAIFHFIRFKDALLAARLMLYCPSVSYKEGETLGNLGRELQEEVSFNQLFNRIHILEISLAYRIIFYDPDPTFSQGKRIRKIETDIKQLKGFDKYFYSDRKADAFLEENKPSQRLPLIQKTTIIL